MRGTGTLVVGLLQGTALVRSVLNTDCTNIVCVNRTNLVVGQPILVLSPEHFSLCISMALFFTYPDMVWIFGMSFRSKGSNFSIQLNGKNYLNSTH